ncbi:MAG TPA: tRNA (adenosine(37)-N6)-threonylcarbamoyltransferase complex dimerization subunit type 1 TsaB, partial [Xanthobacteraceae bacterium]|nr:tRNA (adenosine(37)-N6)-threonylcarbamoyltransferase complex dimerization subunit type 1 TsaB [Xanthobacteraceae bacterium]
MRLLAIDTALAACSAAVYDTEAGVIASESLPMERGHAEALLPLIERVVAAAKTDFSAFDRIVVTVGPGSFTGLRVGVAAARGIALAAKKRAVGVTTLRAMARPHVKTDASVISVIDARHEHVYFQAFDSGGDALQRARIIPLREVADAAPQGPLRIVGNAARLIDSIWPASRGAPMVTEVAAPDIVWVAKLGAQN